MDLILPESVQRALVAEVNAERERQAESAVDSATWLDGALKDIDPELSVVWIGENAAAQGLVPGRFHVRRTNHGQPDSYMPITAPDGGFREPDSGVIDEIGRRDLWRVRDAAADARRAREIADAARRGREEQARAERAEEFAGRVKAELNPAVSMSGKWTNKIRGSKHG